MNHIKFETLTQCGWRIKVPKNCINRSKGSTLRGDYLPKSENFRLFGPEFPPSWTDWCEVSHVQADPRAPWLCQIWHESIPIRWKIPAVAANCR